MDKYAVGDIVKLKKPHPCGSSEWEIMRVGADGRVAAYFEAKENSVSAMIVTDDEQTKKLFEDNITMFEAGISDGEQRVRIDVALEHDISAKESKMSDMKSNTESDNETKKQLDGGESVQTTRLYHIAEQFIVNVQRVIAQDSL